MAIPTNRSEFVDWCLRSLGAPVVEINCDPSQVEDRVDEALSLYTEYHFDGTQRSYYKYQITALDITQGYISLPKSVHSVSRALPFSMLYGSSGTYSYAQYQMLLSDMWNIHGTDLVGYDIGMKNLALINYLINTSPSIIFSYNTGRLQFTNGDGIDSRLREGDWIILEAYIVSDPGVYTRIWSDRWLQKYATALIKRTWAANIKKFDGMALPGGITIDGKGMYQEAIQEIQELEDELMKNYVAPTPFYMG